MMPAGLPAHREPLQRRRAHGPGHRPHYSAAKGGILALTRAVAREVAVARHASRHLPRLIDTPMTAPDLGAVAQRRS